MMYILKLLYKFIKIYIYCKYCINIWNSFYIYYLIIVNFLKIKHEEVTTVRQL